MTRESPDPLCFQGKPFWNPDPFDKLLPATRGFINDFVLSLRGHEVPVAFSIWCSLVALSSTLKRETWLKWSSDPLFPNLYVVIVAPAGMAKKTTPIMQAVHSIEDMGDYINDNPVRQRKALNLFFDKITGEAIGAFLAKKMRPMYVSLIDNTGKVISDGTGKPLKYEKCAEVLLVAPELGTMLSRAKYNEDLITTLTKLYDTDSPFEITTKSGGKKKLPRPHACLMGGTNPAALRDSIPKTAVDEGFLSRLILCYAPASSNLFSRPRDVGIPRKEIASRLAWIVENTAGQWDIDPKAEAFYDKWYMTLHTHFDKLRFHPAQKSRFAIHVLKVALLFSAQRYVDHRKKENRIIDIEAMREAITLVERTMQEAVPLIEETEANPYQRLQLRVLAYMQGRPSITRKQLLQSVHLTAAEATAIVSDLYQAERLYTENGAPNFGLHEKYSLVKMKKKKGSDDDT
jgi:hypothetical protein